MADNTTLNSGVGGDTIRTEDVGGGVKIEAVKIHTGAEAVDGGPVTASNLLPVGATLVDPSSNAPLYPSPFGQLRTVNPYSIAEHINKYEIDTRFYSQIFVTGGSQTFLPNQSAIQLIVTGASAARSLLRTNTYYRYQPGRAQRILTTLYHADTGKANQVRRWGYFDDNDGIFFALSGTTLQAVQRSFTSGAPVDTVVASSSWNVDKMDGTGPSGVTLDITKANIYEIAFQWLGVGIVQLSINGYLVHIFKNPNTLIVPYMRTGQLPLSWEVINSGGASTASSMTYVCSTVISEGGGTPRAETFGFANAADITLGGTLVPLLTIRPKLTYGASSVVNRASVLPILFIPDMTGSTGGSPRALFQLLVNATLSGSPVFNSVNARSTVEVDVAATGVSGGINLLSVFGVSGVDPQVIDISKLFSEDGLKLRLDAAGAVQDMLTIAAVALNATPPARGSLTWQEIGR